MNRIQIATLITVFLIATNVLSLFVAIVAWERRDYLVILLIAVSSAAAWASVANLWLVARRTS